MHLSIGDKKAVAIVDGQAVDPAKVSIRAVFNKGGVVRLRVEDKEFSLDMDRMPAL